MTKEIESLRTLNALLEQENAEATMDLAYLADLLMRVTGCGPTDTIQTAIDRAHGSSVSFTKNGT
jgi:hypothetical protein